MRKVLVIGTVESAQALANAKFGFAVPKNPRRTCLQPFEQLAGENVAKIELKSVKKPVSVSGQNRARFEKRLMPFDSPGPN